MGENLTNFERSLQKAYDKYEAPYDSSSWNAIEAQLNATSAQTSSSAASYVAAIAATIFLIVASFVTYYSVWNTSLTSPKARVASSGEYLNADDIARNRYAESALEDASNDSANSESISNSIERITETTTSSASVPSNENTSNNISNQNNSSEEHRERIVTNNTEGSNIQKQKDGQKPVADELSFAADLKEACAGVSVKFELTTGEIKGSYLWNFGDGNFSNTPNPSHVYSKPRTYDITLSVTSHEDGVIRSKSIKNMIVINPVPEAEFNWEFINESAEAPRVKFINLSDRAKEAKWTLGNEGSNEINPELTFAKAGDFPVKLVVSNDYGCLDSIYQYVSIEEDFKLLAPDAFSPNNDGINDSFMPEALKLRDVNFKLTIYDNNKPIFESSDKHEPWKGVLPNGTLARPGKTFPWVVLLTNEEGKEEFYSGTITIIP